MSDLPRYPDTTGKDLTKRVDELENYIINLHRFLRFALETIDETNMTTGARGQFLEIKGLYAELYADETGLLSRMTNAEGGVSTLQQNVNGLTSTVQNVEGNVSTLDQNVNGLTSTVISVQGDVSTAQSTADSAKTAANNAGAAASAAQSTADSAKTAANNAGAAASAAQSTADSAQQNVSTLTQTVNGLTSTVQNVEGNLSTLTQTVNGFSLDVTNGSTSSVIKLKSGSTEISSQTISMSGLVKFTDLSTAGSTTINGGNITTGKINANLITSGKITAVNIEGVNITGCTIEGGSLKSLGTGDHYDLRIREGRIDWLKPNSSNTYATIAYSTNNGMMLSTDSWITLDASGVIKITSRNNLSINAGDGHGVYIGGDTGTTQSINIGNSNSTVNIKGTVKINGTTLPY